MQGRGLKQVTGDVLQYRSKSPLMQGRGLKPFGAMPCLCSSRSPLMQGRGLKPKKLETVSRDQPCRPLCRGVD